MSLRIYKKGTDLETFSFKGYLEGPLFLYGRTGAGKSVSLTSIAQSYHDSYNYKIWDLDGGPRNENIYWTLPSNDNLYWSRFNRIANFDQEGPKQYKVNLYYPYFKGKFPKKLPKKIINGEVIVKSIPFTIPLKKISKDDIAVVVGNLSESSKYAWDKILHDSSKKDNSGSLLELSKKIKGITNTPIYKNFIIPMARENFIANDYCDYNIDLASEAKDQQTIMVLCLDFVPKEFQLFVLNWISRTVNELLDVNKIPKKNLLLIREAARYFRATDDSILEDKFKIFRSNMAEYIRMGRRGAYFMCDCQSPAETKGIVSGSDDFTLMFRITSFRDKRELCDELLREKKMLNSQVADLAFLDKGQCYINETGSHTVKKVQIRLPRTMYWRKEYGNFYKNVWERFGGEWKQTKEITDNIMLEVGDAEKSFIKNNPVKEEKSNNINKSENIPIINGAQPVKEENNILQESEVVNKTKKILKIPKSVL